MREVFNFKQDSRNLSSLAENGTMEVEKKYGNLGKLTSYIFSKVCIQRKSSFEILDIWHRV